MLKLFSPIFGGQLLIITEPFTALNLPYTYSYFIIQNLQQNGDSTRNRRSSHDAGKKTVQRFFILFHNDMLMVQYSMLRSLYHSKTPDLPGKHLVSIICHVFLCESVR